MVVEEDEDLQVVEEELHLVVGEGKGTDVHVGCHDLEVPIFEEIFKKL